MKTIKIIDDKGVTREVTEKAWDVLYKDRKGFSLYVAKTEEKPKAKAKTKQTARQKGVSSSSKKVKDDESK